MLAAALARPVTPAHASAPPVIPDPCTDCAFNPPTVLVGAAGSHFLLSGDTAGGDYFTAISCGDLACLYPSAYFTGITDPLSVSGDCGQYTGLSGGPTRPDTGTPGKCNVQFDPLDTSIIAPGSWTVVNYFYGTGSFIDGGASFLIATPVEIYVLGVTSSDPVTNEVPAVVFAVRSDADPVAADCGSDVVTGYLPGRVARDCVLFQGNGTSDFAAALPDGDWDILGFNTASPVGKLRVAMTPWKPKRITMAGANQQAEIVRVQYPQLQIEAELLGADDNLSVDEDGVCT